MCKTLHYINKESEVWKLPRPLGPKGLGPWARALGPGPGPGPGAPPPPHPPLFPRDPHPAAPPGRAPGPGPGPVPMGPGPMGLAHRVMTQRVVLA